MLKFTYLINFGLAGALVVPSMTQQLGTVEQLENSIASTDQAIQALTQLEAQLQSGDYRAVEGILRATEKPFGTQRERSVLLDRLREEIGQLDSQLQTIERRTTLPHTQLDPTADLSTDPDIDASSTGLTQEGRDALGGILPPVPGGTGATVRKVGDRLDFEEQGFTVDAIRHGRAYFRAERFEEALRLVSTRRGEPLADYWTGRCLEQLNRPQEALAAYVSVESNPDSPPEDIARAKNDREFLEWKIDFDRKLKDLHGPQGETKK